MDPTAPPQRSGVSMWRVLLRIVLTLVPLLSLGMLAWVALLWLAVERRRLRDWLLFAAAGAAGVGGMALVGPDGGTRTTEGMVLLLGTALAVPAYYLAVEVGPRPAATPAHPYSDRYPQPYQHQHQHQHHQQPHPYAYAPPPVPGYPPPAPQPAPFPSTRPPAPTRPPTPPDRIGQVRAGLDELTAYLEQEDRR
ncbi:hypothetical protein ACFW1A_04080 [Kitasatospora sp. NPDC058965]|uniref:hypothetical protein n=1 Tax=Kitasatospora sp. NPDC058965 TaxID=3346682 RepID=UPI0036B2C114